MWAVDNIIPVMSLGNLLQINTDMISISISLRCRFDNANDDDADDDDDDDVIMST